MTFLQYVYGYSQKATVTFIIISCLALITFSQGVQQQSQGKRYGDPDFVGELANLKVVNTDIRDILNYITDQYGINFVIDKSVKQTPVTITINDVPWNVALDAILSSQELSVQVKGPILRIADKKTLASEVDLELKAREGQLNNSPLYTEFIRLNYARAMGNQQTSGTSTGTPVMGSGGMGGGMGGMGGMGAIADGVLPIVNKRLSKRGSIEIDSRSNSLIVTDVKENIDAIRKLIEILDQPEPQVEIEARVVVATRDFSRDIGVQLAGVAIGKNGRGGYGATMPTEKGENFPPSMNNVQSNDSLKSQIANSVLGLTTGVFGTAQLDLLITAGENRGQAKTIATPRVSTLNNRKATVESGQMIPIVTTQTGANGGGVVFTTEYISVPLKLEVTPQITGDGTVLLDVVVENSSVSSTISIGGQPGISTQSTTVNVMVPDGGTTVIGGAMIDVEGENQFRTPGLSRVPVIGNLFKRKAVSRTTNEIIFFITPRITRPDLPNEGKAKENRQSTTILQPVPLGNPSSNSLPKVGDAQTQPVPLQQNPTTAPVPTSVEPNKP